MFVQTLAGNGGPLILHSSGPIWIKDYVSKSLLKISPWRGCVRMSYLGEHTARVPFSSLELSGILVPLGGPGFMSRAQEAVSSGCSKSVGRTPEKTGCHTRRRLASPGLPLSRRSMNSKASSQAPRLHQGRLLQVQRLSWGLLVPWSSPLFPPLLRWRGTHIMSVL